MAIEYIISSDSYDDKLIDPIIEKALSGLGERVCISPNKEIEIRFDNKTSKPDVVIYKELHGLMFSYHSGEALAWSIFGNLVARMSSQFGVVEVDEVQ